MLLFENVIYACLCAVFVARTRRRIMSLLFTLAFSGEGIDMKLQTWLNFIIPPDRLVSFDVDSIPLTPNIRIFPFVIVIAASIASVISPLSSQMIFCISDYSIAKEKERERGRKRERETPARHKAFLFIVQFHRARNNFFSFSPSRGNKKAIPSSILARKTFSSNDRRRLHVHLFFFLAHPGRCENVRQQQRLLTSKEKKRARFFLCNVIAYFFLLSRNCAIAKYGAWVP